MAQYRKLPVEIHAVKFHRIVEGRAHCEEDLPDWLQAAVDKRDVRIDDDSLIIRTKEGWMRASPGDYIIRGVEGELYPCKPSIFEKTYEPVE